MNIVMKSLSAAALLLLAAGTARAACEGCNYVKRGDRYEGVAVRQISGASLDLLGVQVEGKGAPKAGKDMHVHFFLSAPDTPRIEVRELETNYYMVPDRKSYGAGLQSYVWPRGEVLEPLKLGPDALFLKVSDRDRTVYYPAQLSAGPQPATGGSYVFDFRSGAGLELAITISREEGGTLVPVRKFSHSESVGGTFRIAWDGRDDQGRPAPEGRYLLRLKGDMLAEIIRPINYKVTFLHHGLRS